MVDADIVVVGAGAAGLSLVHRLPAEAASVVLIGPSGGPLRAPDRTWCFWEAGSGRFDPAVTASWQWLRVRGRDGREVRRHIAPARYKMIRSADFEALVGHDLAGRPGVRRLEAAVDGVEALPDGTARVSAVDTGGGRLALRARWVFDSRPAAPPAARTRLLQHFRGWFVRTRRPVFDPAVVELMDFRTRQPERGLSFGYVLPTGRHTALVGVNGVGKSTLLRCIAGELRPSDGSVSTDGPVAWMPQPIGTASDAGTTVRQLLVRFSPPAVRSAAETLSAAWAPVTLPGVQVCATAAHMCTAPGRRGRPSCGSRTRRRPAGRRWSCRSTSRWW